MPVIYNSPLDAIEAAVAMSFQNHPHLSYRKVDKDLVIIRETMIVCKDGLGTRYTAIYRDFSGRYEGYADYCDY
jgi:hypothetical protein